MIWITTLLLACSGGTETADLSSPAAVAGIANEIAASPDKADDILSTHGTDRAAFEAALFDIAEDAGKTSEYLAARK